MAEPSCEASVEVRNADGLHMRPAMRFVDVAGTFESDIQVTDGIRTADGKSIMQMTMLAATYGTVLTIRARGVDAQRAVTVLREVIEQGLLGQPSPPSDVQEDLLREPNGNP